ncbi:RTA1-like protein [Fusarium beomiforme]|uniref:RTA1-like protein n=1 Tax=Fusarium beomiforme TaxID=44412 RepID=A0A9P5DSJ9_9HYPO|nr:RTA1-like protein [Fusarium beomiforme]
MHSNIRALILYLLSGSALAIPTRTQAPEVTLVPRATATETAAPEGWFTTTKNIATIGGTTDKYFTIPAKTIAIVVPTCIQTLEPDENGYLPPGTCNAHWNYYPSFAAAAAFALLFATLTGVHVWQAARYKKVRVNAYAYMTLGRMVYYFIPSQSLIRMPAATLAAVFVGLDILSFIIQLIGGSMASPGSPPDEQMKAVHIYMGGIGLQEFFIVIFVVLCVLFQKKMHAIERQHRGFKAFFTSDWGMLLCTLYFSLAMISVRIIYRLIEFSGGKGQDNALITQEAYFYVLEAAPMCLALLAFNVIHPGRIMTGPNSDMPGLFSFIKTKIRGRKGKQLLDDRSDSDVELKTQYEPTREVGHYDTEPPRYG